MCVVRAPKNALCRYAIEINVSDSIFVDKVQLEQLSLDYDLIARGTCLPLRRFAQAKLSPFVHMPP